MDKKVLITGGAGFIGTHLAHRLAGEGQTVVVYDDLSRSGAEKGLRWLLRMHPDRVKPVIGDVRDYWSLRTALDGVTSVFHLAAQVAMTTSMVDPFMDFDVNARGTLNLIEAIRSMHEPPSLVFTSTNKIIGGLGDFAIRETSSRYVPESDWLAKTGIGEDRPIEFRSPYGCSKGSADQYVLGYARAYGLPATVFRVSCVYGPHQWGSEDDGWVAHFTAQALKHAPVRIFGDGKQVRDPLFVDDLVDALLVASDRISDTRGEAFNIGGGPKNATSLLEMIQRIRWIHGEFPEVEMLPWRPLDQRYYVSDIRKFSRLTGWVPEVGTQEGLRRLYDWMKGTLADEKWESTAQRAQAQSP